MIQQREFNSTIAKCCEKQRASSSPQVCVHTWKWYSMKQKHQHAGCHCACSLIRYRSLLWATQTAPILSKKLKAVFFYWIACSGFGVGLHAVLKIHSQSRATREVKLKESCRTAYAAQTRHFPIQTHNHDKLKTAHFDAFILSVLSWKLYKALSLHQISAERRLLSP